MARKGVLSLGDAFIDYVSRSSDNNRFERKLGGASVNVAVHISRFAIPSFYMTKLGEREDSQFVEAEMIKEKYIWMIVFVHQQSKYRKYMFI